MDENVGRKKRGRNLRACTKCNIGHYDPKDDNCLKICLDRGDGNEPVWILPVGMQAGRRRAQRRRMANNRHQNNENGEINEPGVEINDEDHMDPNYQAESDGEAPDEPANPLYPAPDRVWEDHNMRNPPLRRNIAEGEPIHGRTLPTYTGGARGAINIPINTRRPIDFFRLYFDDTIMGRFVEVSNIYGRKYYGEENGRATTSNELFQMFGILLYMGVV